MIDNISVTVLDLKTKLVHINCFIKMNIIHPIKWQTCFSLMSMQMVTERCARCYAGHLKVSYEFYIPSTTKYLP
jgi:hypothetical protein